MRLTLQKREKFIDEDEYYYSYEILELETFRWEKEHLFCYVVKGSNRWKKLESNEEIVGLQL